MYGRRSNFVIVHGVNSNPEVIMGSRDLLRNHMLFSIIETVYIKRKKDEEMNNFMNETIMEKYEFRNIRPEEADQVVRMEQICFPPNEACSEKHMIERTLQASELFLVAVDKATGKIAGFLNGSATDEDVFRDEFFTDVRLNNPEGKNIMLLGLEVLPEYRGQGLARELMFQYLKREKENGREKVFLTCLDSKVEMYIKMGYKDLGISNSSWGGEEWHDMLYTL